MAEVPILDAAALVRSGGAPVPALVGATDAVVFRAHDGTLGVVGRWCPHLDWDLAEAEVVDGELVCRGHGWSIRATGRVFKRNEFGREDPKGCMAFWPAHERDGKIWVETEQSGQNEHSGQNATEPTGQAGS